MNDVKLSRRGIGILAGIALLCAGCTEPQRGEQSWSLQGDDLEARAELYTLNEKDLDVVFAEIRRGARLEQVAESLGPPDEWR